MRHLLSKVGRVTKVVMRNKDFLPDKVEEQIKRSKKELNREIEGVVGKEEFEEFYAQMEAREQNE